MTSTSSMQGEAHIAAWANTLNAMITGPEPKVDQGENGKKRLVLYRELIRANLEEFINVVFPISRTLISKHTWQKWVDAFTQSEYRRSPLFRDIAASFLDMVTHYPESEVLPALRELMRWEWLEMAVEIAEEEVMISATGKQLNPTLRIEAFNYPVHEMAQQGKQLPPKPTVLLAWRTLQHNVKGWCPDEATLQLLLHLNQAQNNADAEHTEELWRVIAATPALQALVNLLKEKDILL